jgi:RND family efflux transporter MFP subunit
MLALLAAGACARSGAGDSGDDAGAPQVPAVVGAQTAVVSSQPFVETVNAIGLVAPRAGHVASLAAPAPTRVAKIFVTLGQHVSAGQELVQFEQATFDAALRSADAAVDAAQRAYDRAQRLAAQGIAPRKDVDQAAADLAQARLNQVAARRDQELSTLRAPIAGVVTEMNAVLGASADMSRPLVEVMDPAALDVILQLSPDDAARVRPQQEVQLSAGQSAGGESLGTGRVADVAAEVDSATRTVAVRVVTAKTLRPLRAGETLMGAIVVARVPNALAIPVDALVPEGEGYHVFVVDSGSVAHVRDVKVGARTEQFVEIRDGLKPGERVVTHGAFGVSDSARIVTGKP